MREKKSEFSADTSSLNCGTNPLNTGSIMLTKRQRPWLIAIVGMLLVLVVYRVCTKPQGKLELEFVGYVADPYGELGPQIPGWPGQPVEFRLSNHTGRTIALNQPMRGTTINVADRTESLSVSFIPPFVSVPHQVSLPDGESISFQGYVKDAPKEPYRVVLTYWEGESRFVSPSIQPWVPDFVLNRYETDVTSKQSKVFESQPISFPAINTTNAPATGVRLISAAR